MNKPLIYRQGDVLIVQVDAIPTDAAPCAVNGDVILAYGEMTGHCHRLAPETVKPFAKGGVWSADAERFITVALEGAQLKHEEHATVAIPPGNYRVVQQMEYHPAAIRNVAD